MSDQTKVLNFRDTALSLRHIIAELTASLMPLESGETLHIIWPSLTDKQFQKWTYAVGSLCKQWDALTTNGKTNLQLIKREDGRRECLYVAEFDIQKRHNA